MRSRTAITGTTLEKVTSLMERFCRGPCRWQATLDALLLLPEIGGRVGMAGGVISIGTRLAVVEPRISAAVLFAGSFVPRAILEEARQVAIPLLAPAAVGR